MLSNIAVPVLGMLMACVPKVEESSEVKHSLVMRRTESGHKRQFYENFILIKKLKKGKENQLNIKIKFENDDSFTENDKSAVKASVEEAFNKWLRPLREYEDNSFVAVAVGDSDFFKTEDIKPDLEIIFKDSNGSRSRWKFGLLDRFFGGIARIEMYESETAAGENKIPGDYDFHALLHEVGHAIGLGHPIDPNIESVMSKKHHYGRRGKHRGKANLTHDDISGVVHLWQYYGRDYDQGETCPSDEHEWNKEEEACVLRFPVAYYAEYGDVDSLRRLFTVNDKLYLMINIKTTTLF